MQCNDAGIALIKHFEGLSLTAYKCQAGVWTIGYGHTSTAKQGKVITEKEADALLRQDLRNAELAVSRLVKTSLTDNQFSALCSFVFNLGSQRLLESTLLKHLNNGWYEKVPVQLMRWNKAAGKVSAGLCRRRKAECKLWKTT